MKTRIISGAVFTAVLAVVFFLLPNIVTAIALMALCMIASYELIYTTGLVKSVRLNICSAAMAALVPLWSYFGCDYRLMLWGILLYTMLLFGELLISSGKTPVAQLAYCLLSGLIVPFLLSALMRIRNGHDGQIMLLIPFIMAYCSDTGAYFVGVFLGKHKMCPNISPKKSWEGFIGGICVAVAAMLLFAGILSNAAGYTLNYGYVVLYGLAGSLGSVFGDLMMSVIKRQTGIKDYGNLIPGHGGILDRFDSVLITAPLTEALLLLIPMVV